jgi:DNA-binding winged helix-turn-helix (wHTH) protein/pimeloyl-ACP methyl ester carboxylesterase
VTYAFGAHELDVDRLELRHAGTPVPMEPQTFDVLVYLVRHRERVVAKEELMDEVWGGRFVSETAVTSRIKQARRALGDDGRAQGFIRTHHGRGYRFVADVSETASTPQGARPAPASGDLDLPVLHVAGLDYHLAGQGPPDLVLLAGAGRDLTRDWEDPARGRFLRALVTMARLIRADLPAGDPEAALRDLVVVLDDAACARAVLLGDGAGGPLAVLAATTYPERFSALVLYGTSAACDDPPVDVRPLLAGVTQRTLVLHRSEDPEVRVQSGRGLAAQIPQAELVELPGGAHAAEADPDQVLEAMADLVEDAAVLEAPRQSLTALVGIAGDDPESLVSVLVSLGGRVRQGPEHALVVSFDGPATAVRALASRRARGFLSGVGVGVAIDEVDRDALLVSGHGVDVARLMAARAQRGEVLVPNVIKDLLAGSGLHVEPVGVLDLPHVGPHPAYRWLRS